MADIFALFDQIAKDKKKEVGPPTHLIVGLGNPGKEYLVTRHNAGFIAADFIARRCDTECTRARFSSLNAQITVGTHRVLLMKPQTFMNNSGEAVRDAAQFYKIAPENILVLVDDIHLAPGRMRIRRSGSDGGHNGLKSIIYQLGSDQFPRIRLGVGEAPPGGLIDWVLGKLTKSDLSCMTPCFDACFDAAQLIFDGHADEAMGRFNGKLRSAETENNQSETNHE